MPALDDKREMDLAASLYWLAAETGVTEIFAVTDFSL
jgi:hypothetical protein